MAIKAGQRMTCAACGAETVAKKEAAYDGWTKTGEAIVCAECGVTVAGSAAADAAKEKRRLAGFLDTDESIEKPTMVDIGEKPLCRDCVSYVEHPFATRCDRHKKIVSPTDDCDDFELKASLA